VRAALPSSRAAGPRAPGAALLGSSCAGNPSSWAWAAILSSCHALASSTPVSRPLETLGARWVNWLSLAIAQQRQSVTAPPSSCRAVSRATRPQARGARARPRVATPHPFRNAPLWRCRVVLYSSTKLPGTDRPATAHASATGFDIHGRSRAAPTTASIAPSPHSPRPAYCSAMRRANGALNPAGIRGPRWPQRLTSAPRPVARSCIATALPLTPCRALALDEPIGVDPMGVISIAIRVFAQRRHQR